MDTQATLNSGGAATLQVGTLNAAGDALLQAFGAAASGFAAVNAGVVVPSTTIVNDATGYGKLAIQVAGAALTAGGTVHVRLVCTRA
jgi:hypothetical protein